MTTRKTSTVSFPLVLKTLHDDIVTANPTSTITTKKMRVTLRAQMAAIHARNSSWTFTSQSEYDAARSLFDPAYAARIAKPARAKPAKKVKTSVANVEPVSE